MMWVDPRSSPRWMRPLIDAMSSRRDRMVAKAADAVRGADKPQAPKCPFCRMHVPNHCKDAAEAARCMFMPKQQAAGVVFTDPSKKSLQHDIPAIVENFHNSDERHPVVAFMLMRMQRADGHELDVDLLYPAYLAWHGGGAGSGEPLSAQSFGDSLAYIFRRAHIRTKRDGDRVLCVGVRLV